jgi:hypothetical protein
VVEVREVVGGAVRVVARARVGAEVARLAMVVVVVGGGRQW